MQQGRSELVEGERRPDGALVFETTVRPYEDEKGRLRFRGRHVQGKPDEAFLYLSWRVAGHGAWTMRAKVMLTHLTVAFLTSLPDGATLETEMARLGGRTPGQVQEWRLV